MRDAADASPMSPDGFPAALHALNILDNISDAVVALDEAWRFTYANASGLALGRQSREAMLGSPVWELFPELVGTIAEQAFRRAMAGRTRESFEYFHEPFALWVEADVYPTPGGITVVFRDIGKRKEAEAERERAERALEEERARLRLSDERFRVALRGSPTVVFNQDAELRYTWVYNALEEFGGPDWLGLSDEALGEAARELVELKREVLRTGQQVSREVAVRLGNEVRHYHFQLEPLHGAGGAVTGLTGSATDVTAQRQARQRIERQETQLRLVIDAIPALVSYIDRDCRYRFVNSRYGEWFHRSTSEIEGRTIEEAFGAKMFAAIEPWIRQALAGRPVSYTASVEYPDRPRWVRASYVPEFAADGSVRGAVILIQDITDAHRAEQELRGSEEQYRFLANALPQLVWIADAKAQTEFLNDYWFEYTGATREEGIRAFPRVVRPEDAAALARAWEAASSARVPFDIEHRIRRASDGEERWHLARIKPVLDEGGAVLKWVGTALDIHDRKTSELELKKARRDLADIIDSISESFIALDREWRFMYVNAEVAKRLGVAREDLIGRNIWEVVPEASRAAFQPKYEQVMRDRVAAHWETPFPPDRWFDVYAHPTESGMSAYIVEKTEQKRTEEALRQKAKLESIGLLAGGVAHDFNNLLVGILGAASLAQESMEADRPERELIRLIADSAERAADLTRQMLTYAGRSRADKQPVDLNAVVNDTVQLLRSTVRPSVRVGMELEPGLPLLTGDPGQIQQVVLNLLTNAIEAIPEGAPGQVRVRAALRRELRDRNLGIELLTAGEYVELEVQDNGAGMTPEVLDRIFDPFFTTKFTGRGLGLAAVQGIVRNHQGGIEVRSVPGEGTTFRVLLRASGAAARVEAGASRGETAQGGVVLVIDDEAAVRTTAERILKRHGYTVLLGDGAAKGIERFRAGPGRIDVLIVDVSMPEQSGFDVLRALGSELDGVRVILSSGHGEQDLENELERFPGVRFLRKPYRSEELLRAVREGTAGAPA